MKSTLLMALTSLLLLTQCRKPSVNLPVPEDDNTVNMTVTVGHGRTDISTAGAITWAEGDRLYVAVEGKYKGFLTLVPGGGGSATGTFRGNVSNVTGSGLTFHFFYLGSGDYTSLAANAETVDIDFSSQTGALANLSGCHVGHGSATGSVDVSGNVILDSTDPVTMTSKVAIAYLGFKKAGEDYSGALTLGGTNICNAMTVNFNGESFTGKKVGAGGISLTNTASAQKYVMLVPTGSTSEETLYFGGAGVTGSTTLYNGIEANKFYRNAGDNSAIGVLLVNAYVDLGLTVEWATINLGATRPEEYGNYYAWGETAGYNEAMVGAGANAGSSYSPGTVKTDYSWLWYKWGSGTKNLGKYVNKAGYGMDEPDGITTLQSADDAATANWGTGWRMPTYAEIKALNSLTKEWISDYNGSGVAGYIVHGTGTCSANSIFLPAAGYRSGTSLVNAGCGYYWSSTLFTGEPDNGRSVYFDLDSFYVSLHARSNGFTVRPVRASQK